MTLDEIIRNLKSGYWLEEAPSLFAYQAKYIADRGDLHRIASELKKYLQKGKRGRAVNWTVVGLVLQHDRFLSVLRREGLLRASKYFPNEGTVKFVAARILQYAEKLRLPKTTVAYLRSISALHALAPAVRTTINKLSNKLRRMHEFALRGLLVTLDYHLVFRGRLTYLLGGSQGQYRTADSC